VIQQKFDKEFKKLMKMTKEEIKKTYYQRDIE
jgi:hypothetical protein